MPHGKIVLFPTIMLSIAATLSMITLLNCYFVEGDTNYMYAGFWPLCSYIPYPASSTLQYRHEDDPIRKVAMSFGLIAFIVGTGAMISLWPITCCPYPVVGIRFIGGHVVFVFISQLLTLSMLGTEYCVSFGCRLAWGGVMSIIAAVCCLIGAVGVFIIPKPIEMSTRNNNTNETINITATMQPDGTKVTEKVTTSPDGTKMVERTIESTVGVEQPQGDLGHSVAHAALVP